MSNGGKSLELRRIISPSIALSHKEKTVIKKKRRKRKKERKGEDEKCNHMLLKRIKQLSMVSHTNKSSTIGAETVSNEFGDALDR